MENMHTDADVRMLKVKPWLEILPHILDRVPVNFWWCSFLPPIRTLWRKTEWEWSVLPKNTTHFWGHNAIYSNHVFWLPNLYLIQHHTWILVQLSQSSETLKDEMEGYKNKNPLYSNHFYNCASKVLHLSKSRISHYYIFG